jgi:hypothetical protein
MITSTNNQTMMQLSAPPEMRGRVVALNQLNPALIAAGSFLIGPIADWIGARGAAVAASVACTLLGIALLCVSSRLRELRLSQYTGAVSR